MQRTGRIERCRPSCLSFSLVPVQALLLGLLFVPSLVALSTSSQLRTSSSTQAEARQLNIFGKDSRKPIEDASIFPYSVLGLVQHKDHACTATLINKQYVVTSAECISSAAIDDMETDPPVFVQAPSELHPSITSQDTIPIKQAHWQSDYWTKWTDNTYVILKLGHPLPDADKVVELPHFNDKDGVSKTPVQLAGYTTSNDRKSPQLKYSICTCYFARAFNGPEHSVHHNCDTSGEMIAGAPLLVQYSGSKTYMLAMHTGGADTDNSYASFTQSNANIGVQASFIRQHLNSLLESNGSNASSTNSDVADDSHSSAVDDPSNAQGLDVTSETPAHSFPISLGVVCLVALLLTWIAMIWFAVRELRRKAIRQSNMTDASPQPQMSSIPSA